MRVILGRAAIALAGLLTVLTASDPGPAGIDPLTRLAGRWAGQGTVVPASGSPETFKCVVTYFPGSEGAGLKQNLRCKSDNYRLETATWLDVTGTSVRGRWEEKIFGLDGEVTGTVTPDGFDILLSGKFFRARMAVSQNGCQQSVRVAPDRQDYIRELSASLTRC